MMQAPISVREDHQQTTRSSAIHSVRQSWRTRHEWITQVENSRELGLDSTLEGTFPCSDPLSSIPNPPLQRE